MNTVCVKFLPYFESASIIKANAVYLCSIRGKRKLLKFIRTSGKLNLLIALCELITKVNAPAESLKGSMVYLSKIATEC